MHIQGIAMWRLHCLSVALMILLRYYFNNKKQLNIKHHYQYPTIFLYLILLLLYGCKPDHKNDKNWSSYLGDKSVSHYSSLQQIDTSNVQQLKVAWEYHTGDADMK